MFRNYVSDATLRSPVNLAIGRVLLGTYLIWKTLSIQWGRIAEWPVYPFDSYTFLAHPTFVSLLPALQWVVVAFLILFIVGYRLRIVTFATSLLIAPMAGILMMFTWSGNTEAFFLSIYILLCYGLYADQDELSVDGVRRTVNWNLPELQSFLNGRGDDRRYRGDALRWSLLMIGILYFGSGFSKIVRGPLFDWATSESLGRHIRGSHHRLGIEPTSGELFLSLPDPLIALAAWSTIGLEVGLLIVTLAGFSIAPVVVAMIGLHITIAFVQGPVFLDMIIILGLFASWGAAYRWLAADRSDSVDLVYDEHCYFCARSLYAFKLLDVNGSVNFLTQYTAPAEYSERKDVNFDDAMYVFDGDRAYEGYYAFRRLLKQFRVFVPIVWLMGLPLISDVGEYVYQYIAGNRSRHFVCDVDLSD